MGNVYRRNRAEIFTAHCRQRMNQRGITQPVIDDVLQYGREKFVRGAVTYFVGNREVAFYAQRGIDLQHCMNVHVVCASDGPMVFTTYVNQEIRRPPRQRYDHRPVSQRGHCSSTRPPVVLGKDILAEQNKGPLS